MAPGSRGDDGATGGLQRQWGARPRGATTARLHGGCALPCGAEGLTGMEAGGVGGRVVRQRQMVWALGGAAGGEAARRAGGILEAALDGAAFMRCYIEAHPTRIGAALQPFDEMPNEP